MENDLLCGSEVTRAVFGGVDLGEIIGGGVQKEREPLQTPEGVPSRALVTIRASVVVGGRRHKVLEPKKEATLELYCEADGEASKMTLEKMVYCGDEFWQDFSGGEIMRRVWFLRDGDFVEVTIGRKEVLCR